MSKSLKIKTEDAFVTYLSGVIAGPTIVPGHSHLEDPPEDGILVWARDIGLYEDMPSETGVRIVDLVIRVEVPGGATEGGDSDLSTYSADVEDAMRKIDSIRAALNLNGADPDLRATQGFHVYDVDIQTNVDERSEDYTLEASVFRVTCGEHDG